MGGDTAQGMLKVEGELKLTTVAAAFSHSRQQVNASKIHGRLHVPEQRLEQITKVPVGHKSFSLNPSCTVFASPHKNEMI